VLSVTPAGRALYEQAMVLFREREKEMFGCLSAHEMQTLDKLLTKILRSWHQRK
jgi:DNA-binding MarR family transcriptional regulator